jgi:hypothetical protein
VPTGISGGERLVGFMRRIDRVRLHADLSILGRLAVALDKARRAQETHERRAA